MFTGIIQDMGRVEFLSENSNSLRIGILTKLSKEHLTIGASVACNGCCLTVIETQQIGQQHLFCVDVGPETLKATCFANLKVGSFLNLEPALRMGDPLSGHQVTGHIDTSCDVVGFEPLEDGFWKLSLLVEKTFSKWVIPKGSIAVAGVSLTVAHKRQAQEGNTGDVVIDIMIIPHTYAHTILQHLDFQQEHMDNTRQKIEVEFDHLIKAIASTIENMVPIYI